jgi:hypothetical protein
VLKRLSFFNFWHSEFFRINLFKALNRSFSCFNCEELSNAREKSLREVKEMKCKIGSRVRVSPQIASQLRSEIKSTGEIRSVYNSRGRFGVTYLIELDATKKYVRSGKYRLVLGGEKDFKCLKKR